MFSKPVILAVLALLFGMLLFFKGSASWGSKSNSLSLLRVCLAFCFFIIMWDTANDYRIAEVQTGGSASDPKQKRVSRVTSSASARSVVKEKYSLLQFMLGLVGFLYLLSRPDTWQFARRFALALRGVDSRPDHEYLSQDLPPVSLPPMKEEDFEDLLKTKAPIE